MSPKIVYGAIAYKKNIIAFYSRLPIINPIIESLLINYIDHSINIKRSFYPHEKTYDHTVQYVVCDDFVYISAATKDLPQFRCFNFLDAISTRHIKIEVNGMEDELIEWIDRYMVFYSIHGNEELDIQNQQEIDSVLDNSKFYLTMQRIKTISDCLIV